MGTYLPQVNVFLSIESVAEKSNTPTSKSMIVTFQRAKEMLK